MQTTYVSDRVKLKDDVAFLGAKATNPVQWTVSQDVRSEGHRVVTLHCRRKDISYSQRQVRVSMLTPVNRRKRQHWACFRNGLMDNEFEVLTWPPNSPDLNPIELLWDVLDKQVRSMKASSGNLQDLKDLLLKSLCQIPQHTFSDLVESIPQWGSLENPQPFGAVVCGEEGHIATKCRALPNTDQVIQKLIGSLRRAKSEKSDTDDKGKPQNQACFSKKSQIDLTESRSLPKGLVGPASTVMVKLNGQECQALLDTGSQVTIVFDSWFSRNLPDVPIHPLTGLSIWGLSSSSYPYKGYVVIDVTFPASVTGVEESLSILALVCPDPKGPPQVPVIIGTNASFFKRLAALSQGVEGSTVAQVLKIQTRHIAIQLPQLQDTGKPPDQPEGNVRWMGPGDCVVPPRGEIRAICRMETDKAFEN
ncbi:hypothetical protein QTP86_000920 [Hemibagrus guttatus]|nr:hypothetical protein QTP86_000920 [Hemibagrus guttatus]